MLKRLKLPALFIMMVLTLSCNHNTRPKEVKEVKKQIKVADSTAVPLPGTATNDLVSFISGMADFKGDCYSKLDTKVNWKQYSKEIDSLFSFGNSLRIKKMKSWADSELIRNSSIKTVFYPFSGPDFLNADIYYPNASQYIMIGLEPIGSLPDICNMPPKAVKSYLNSVSSTLKELLKRSYFITMKMTNDLSKAKVNGTLPMMSIFIKRTGHQIVSIQRIGVDSLGNCQVIDSTRKIKNLVQGVRIDFTSSSGKNVQSVLYFRTDISDKGLEKNPGFKTYLSKVPQSFTFLKAASFLMHSDSFKFIRTCIFDASSTILQDDSGIAYKYFDKQKWKIKLYGKYSKPKGEFSYIREPDLEAAFKHTTAGLLPYSLGYNWGTNHTSLLYAIKK
jgi:hypothetical protein